MICNPKYYFGERQDYISEYNMHLEQSFPKMVYLLMTPNGSVHLVLNRNHWI